MIRYQNEQLFVDDVPAQNLLAQFDSPLYVYSADDIRRRVDSLRSALAPLEPHFHYSVKANSNLSILGLMHSLGLGFDIVSGGELARLQAIQAPLNEVSFAGVGKSQAELAAALQANIGFFTVESPAELHRLAQTAQSQGQRARVLLRINPNVDAHTHRYITTGKAINKFGVDFETASQLRQTFSQHPHVQILGFHTHIGSQIQQARPYGQATQKMLDFIRAQNELLPGQAITHLSLGGGFGIAYQDDSQPLPLDELAQAIVPLLQGRGLHLYFEPGRSLIARAGLLLCTVEYSKQAGDKTFVIIDSGMHHLIRPALYEGWHKIAPLQTPPPNTPLNPADVVGPICESADFLGKDRPLPPLEPGDGLAVFNAGAYGMSMASNYNSHPRPAEVLVDGNSAQLIRMRERYADLFALEISIQRA